MKRKTVRLLCAALLLVTGLFGQSQRGPVYEPEEHDWCGFTPVGDNRIARTTAPSPVLATLPTFLPPGSTVTCGKFRAIFMDVVGASGFGFDDPTLGTTRKNCVCDVLNYITSVITIPANIGTSDPYIDILFNASTNLPASPTLASAGPVFPAAFYSSTAGYYQGYVYDYITTGVKPDPLSEDGTINVNFGKPYGYCTPVIGDCDYDFQSVILHEMTHLLGFASLIRENTGLTSIESAQAPNVFTEFDRRFLYYWNGTTFDKLVDITLYSGSGGVNPAVPANPFSSTNSNRIWLQNQSLSTSRENQPIESTTGFTFGRSLSHYDNQYLYYLNRCNTSPGFVPNYVMSASVTTHQFKRAYTTQELRWLQAMGYVMSASYVPNSYISNRPPRTLGNVVGPMYGSINNTPPCANSDLYITTTSCQPVTINLATNTITNGTTTHTLGLSDPDGNPITVFNGQLMNLRGCGNGGNNHNRLTINGAYNIITFTPRPNFLGRANFAFHLYDGKDRGSYIVVSIDVTADGCTVNTSGEYVMNGGFEEGEEFRTFASPNATLVEENEVIYYYNGNRFADGMQFISPGWQDMSVRESWVNCLYGASSLSFPAPASGLLASGTGGNRFVHFSGFEEFNMTLIPNITAACGPYKFQMEVRFPASVPIGTVYPITISFTNSISGTTFVNPVTFNVTNTGTWQTVSTTFAYTAATMSHMHIYSGGGLTNYLYIDNLSITKQNTPLTVTAAAAPNPTCVGTSTLVSSTVSGGTSPYTYSWVPTFTTAPSFSTTYATSGTNNYTVVVTDANGCTGNAALTVTVQPTVTVTPTPPTWMCQSDPAITLTGLPSTGTWSGSGISSSGVFNPASAVLGPNVITFSAPGYCSKTYTITVGTGVGSTTWPKHPTGTSREFFNGVVKTSNGDIIAAGYYTTDVTIPGFPTWSVTPGQWQLMVCRFSENCGTMWAVNLGNTTTSESVNDIAIDAAGNVYITGNIAATTTFGSVTLTGPAAYILKLDGNTGAVLAGKASSVLANAAGTYLTVDGGGMIYMEGSFTGTIQFGSLASMTSNAGSNDVFIVRYNNALTELWSTSFGSPSYDYPGGISANTSNLYAAANINETFTISSTTFTNATTNTTDMFIGRFNISTGAYISGRMEGNATNSCTVRDILIDASSNVYFTGAFQGTFSVASTALIASSVDIHIGRWTGAFANSWAYSLGGTNTDQGISLSLDGVGNVYYVGTYSGNVTFTGFTPSALTGGFNTYVVKLSTGGVKSYAAQSITTSSVNCTNIVTLTSGQSYVSGYFVGTATFGTSSPITSTATDAYIARLGTSGTFFRMGDETEPFEATENIQRPENHLAKIYPNPTNGLLQVVFSNEADAQSRVYIMDASGRTMETSAKVVSGNQFEMDLSGLSNGLYFVVIENNGERTIEKVMVNR